jgi:DNA-directed RNA polymerase specialized sigma24 family protein
VPLDDFQAEGLPAREPQPGDAMMLREFARTLKQGQRAVLGCLLAGLTWREAGAALGCTSANVAYHMRHIRRRYDEWNSGD